MTLVFLAIGWPYIDAPVGGELADIARARYIGTEILVMSHTAI